MLVLQRRVGEEIHITTPNDGRIVVTLAEVCGLGKARIGVTAPRSVVVHRREVAEAIAMEGERRTAAAPLPASATHVTGCPICTDETPGAICVEHPDMGAIYATCPCRQTVHPEAVNYASVD